MHLNSALASSFLFVPIVLADYSPGEHQPRFHNSVNENINDATGWISQVPWAGAVLPKDNGACLFRTFEGSYNFATGTFKAPSVSGDHGITIAVGIGGRGEQCDIAFAAGIDVLVNGNVVSYLGWAAWGAKSALANISISLADTIRVSVGVFTATTGIALLENINNDQYWSFDFDTDEPVVCQQSAEWVVTSLANYPPNEMPISKFSEVTFEGATAHTHGKAFVMPGPRANIVNEIESNNTQLTTATVYEGTVVIASTR